MYRGLLGLPFPDEPLRIRADTQPFSILNTRTTGTNTVFSIFCGSTETLSLRRDAVLTLTGDSNVPAVVGGNSGFRPGSVALGYSFSGGTGVALCSDALGANTVVGGNATGLLLSSTARVRWTSGGLGSVQDLELYRDAANTLAQRNGTNAQTLRLYETFTDASNGAWFQVQAVSSRYEIGGRANGTGNVRPILLQHGTVTIANLPTASAAGAGARMVVSDALSPTFGATVASGGAVVIPVYSDGTNWRVG
jgi:hypothetical protein